MIYNDIPLQTRTNIDELGDVVLARTAKHMFYAANDLLKRASCYGLEFNPKDIEFTVVNKYGATALRVNMSQSYWKRIMFGKSEKLVYILLKTIVENLSFFQTAFPGGIFTNNINITSNKDYSYTSIFIDYKTFPFEINQKTMAGLQWLSANFKRDNSGTPENIRVVIFDRIARKVDDNTTDEFEFFYKFLCKLCYIDSACYTLVSQLYFLSVCYGHYLLHNNCDISDIAKEIREKYADHEHIPAEAVMNYLIEMNKRHGF